MSQMANKAMISKSKSIYGTFLKADDYKKLMGLRSVGDIVSYLKKHPHFSNILKDVSEHTVHRGQLELLIRKNHFEHILKLIHVIYSKDLPYYELSILKQEHELLLSVIRTMISDDPEDLRGKIPYFFDMHTGLDLARILKAENFDDLLSALESSIYYEMLKPFQVKDLQQVRYLDIEFKLESYYYDEVFKRIDLYYKGALNKALKDIYYTKIELLNIIKIYRLKKFYQSDPITIKNLLVMKHSRMRESKWMSLIDVQNPNELLSYLSKSDFQYFKNEKDYVYVEYYAGKIRYELAKKYMYFATEVPKVFTAFMTLSDIQIENITNIIEGIRYQIPEHDMQQMLIY